jgi:hypothetical protein
VSAVTGGALGHVVCANRKCMITSDFKTKSDHGMSADKSYEIIDKAANFSE